MSTDVKIFKYFDMLKYFYMLTDVQMFYNVEMFFYMLIDIETFYNVD